MFRWTNKQPGIHKFWNLCGLYQDIYDRISPLNKPSGWQFILTQQCLGRNEYDISGHLHIFTFLRRNFFRASFLHLIKDTDIACRDMQLRFFKVKTLLNDAFKYAPSPMGIYKSWAKWASLSHDQSFRLSHSVLLLVGTGSIADPFWTVMNTDTPSLQF